MQECPCVEVLFGRLQRQTRRTCAKQKESSRMPGIWGPFLVTQTMLSGPFTEVGFIKMDSRDLDSILIQNPSIWACVAF